MTTRSYESATILLLRRLAGRLADATLMSLWSYLGAGEYGLLEDTLFGCLEQEGVALTQQELSVLQEMLDDPADSRLAEVTARSTEEPQPQYRFTSSTEDHANESTIAEADRVVIGRASERSAVRRVLRVRRLPADSADTAPATWVYLVEVAVGTYIPHILPDISSELLIHGIGSYPVEVVAEGEELPLYQSSALAAARQIWPTDGGSRS